MSDPIYHALITNPIEGTANSLMGHQGANRLGLLNSVYAGSAHGSARQAWIELARPLSTINMNADIAAQIVAPTAAGKTLSPTSAVPMPLVQLPIGMDIKSILVCESDIDNWNWCLVQFTFGTLTLVNPVSTPGASSLAPFDPRLERVDRLAPWIGSKTKVDVQASATVQNGYFGNSGGAAVGSNAVIFHGFSINAFQEEQVCAIQTRIEPTGRNVGNYDILGPLMHGYAAIAGTTPNYPQHQPPAATGHAMQLNPNFAGFQMGGGFPPGSNFR